MCGSMVDILSAAAEIRRGKKKKEEGRRKKIETTGQKYNGLPPALLHRAAIGMTNRKSITGFPTSYEGRTLPLKSSICMLLPVSGFLTARRFASSVPATAIPSVCPSVRLSVRPSVTRRYCVKTTHVARCSLHCRIAKCV